MIFLYIVLAAVLLLIGALMVNTAVQASKAKKLQAPAAKPSDEAISHYAQRLAKMIQCKTVSVKDS